MQLKKNLLVNPKAGIISTVKGAEEFSLTLNFSRMMKARACNFIL